METLTTLTTLQQTIIESWNIDEETKQYFIDLYEKDNKLVQEIIKNTK